MVKKVTRSLLGLSCIDKGPLNIFLYFDTSSREIFLVDLLKFFHLSTGLCKTYRADFPETS